MNKQAWIIVLVSCVICLGVGTGFGMLVVNSRPEVKVEVAVPSAPEAQPMKERKITPIGSGNELKSEYEAYEKKWEEIDRREKAKGTE